MQELKLHDIKDIVEIPDNSIYYFSGLVFLIILALVILGWMVYKFLKRRHEIDMQKAYMKNLLELDLGQTKESAYALTMYGDLLDKDEQQEDQYAHLIEALEAFKYRKEVETFDQHTLDKIQKFLDTINA